MMDGGRKRYFTELILSPNGCKSTETEFKNSEGYNSERENVECFQRANGVLLAGWD